MVEAALINPRLREEDLTTALAPRRRARDARRGGRRFDALGAELRREARDRAAAAHAAAARARAHQLARAARPAPVADDKRCARSIQAAAREVLEQAGGALVSASNSSRLNEMALTLYERSAIKSPGCGQVSADRGREERKPWAVSARSSEGTRAAGREPARDRGRHQDQHPLPAGARGRPRRGAARRPLPARLRQAVRALPRPRSPTAPSPTSSRRTASSPRSASPWPPRTCRAGRGSRSATCSWAPSPWSPSR